MPIPRVIRAVQMNSSNDEELTRRLQRRDAYAMAELYDRYGKVVWSLILMIVRDPAIAEDLVEETFLQVWNRVHGLDAKEDAIGPWLIAIARNRAIAHLRSRNSRIDPGDSDRDVREHPSLFIRTDPNALDADHLRAMQTVFGKMTPDQRKAFDLAYYEGLSEPQIAERLGESVSNVKAALLGATNLIRAELGQAVSA